MWTDAYHESVAVLDEDVPGAAVAFEESLQIAFPHAVGQTAHVNSWPDHSSAKGGAKDSGRINIWDKLDGGRQDGRRRRMFSPKFVAQFLLIIHWIGTIVHVNRMH